jgi:hypothetical protein
LHHVGVRALILAILVADSRASNRDIFLARASLGLPPVPTEEEQEREENFTVDAATFRREMAAIEARAKAEQDPDWE